jgi:bacteriocin-like protein
MENNSQEETKPGIKTGELSDEELKQVNGGTKKPETEEIKKKKTSVPKFRPG